MIPPPPRSTLFPSTTLFRSNRDVRPLQAKHVERVRFPPQAIRDRARLHDQRAVPFDLVALGRVADVADVQVPGEEEIDRKSTRLNSSHSQISYAVFCLKKKN